MAVGFLHSYKHGEIRNTLTTTKTLPSLFLTGKTLLFPFVFLLERKKRLFNQKETICGERVRHTQWMRTLEHAHVMKRVHVCKLNEFGTSFYVSKLHCIYMWAVGGQDRLGYSTCNTSTPWITCLPRGLHKHVLVPTTYLFTGCHEKLKWKMSKQI